MAHRGPGKNQNERSLELGCYPAGLSPQVRGGVPPTCFRRSELFGDLGVCLSWVRFGWSYATYVVPLRFPQRLRGMTWLTQPLQVVQCMVVTGYDVVTLTAYAVTVGFMDLGLAHAVGFGFGCGSALWPVFG